MSCGMCGGGGPNPPRWEVTLPDGTRRVFLTQTEARIAATQAGGGTITRLAPEQG